MRKHIVKVKAIYWQKNGKKRYDIWQGKEIDDKDNIDIKDTMTYMSNEQGNNSNYKEMLINKIMELDSKMPGLTHLEIWCNGYLINIFRVTKLPSKGEFKNWKEVIESIKG